MQEISGMKTTDIDCIHIFGMLLIVICNVDQNLDRKKRDPKWSGRGQKPNVAEDVYRAETPVISPRAIWSPAATKTHYRFSAGSTDPTNHTYMVVGLVGLVICSTSVLMFIISITSETHIQDLIRRAQILIRRSRQSGHDWRVTSMARAGKRRQSGKGSGAESLPSINCSAATRCRSRNSHRATSACSQNLDVLHL